MTTQDYWVHTYCNRVLMILKNVSLSLVLSFKLKCLGNINSYLCWIDLTESFIEAINDFKSFLFYMEIHTFEYHRYSDLRI